MVEHLMSRSRGNRSGRRTFRSGTPPPRQENLTNQKIIKTEEKDTNLQNDNNPDDDLVEELPMASGNDTVLINAQEIDNKEVVVTRKRPPSPNAIVLPAAKKPAVEISGVEITEISTEEILGDNKTIAKQAGKPPGGQLQQNAAAAKDARSLTMPPPLIGKSESSASKVLTEEFQKQLGQENSKLRALIIREVRKPGKSESLLGMLVGVFCGCWYGRFLLQIVFVYNIIFSLHSKCVVYIYIYVQWHPLLGSMLSMVS